MLKIHPCCKAKYGYRCGGGREDHNRASCTIASLFSFLSNFNPQRHEHRERKRGKQEIFGRVPPHAKNRDPFIQHAVKRTEFSQSERNTDQGESRKNQLQSFSRGEDRENRQQRRAGAEKKGNQMSLASPVEHLPPVCRTIYGIGIAEKVGDHNIEQL